MVLRVDASKGTELVAVEIDAPVENKPQTCGWNYRVNVVIQNNTVCLDCLRNQAIKQVAGESRDMTVREILQII